MTAEQRPHAPEITEANKTITEGLIHTYKTQVAVEKGLKLRAFINDGNEVTILFAALDALTSVGLNDKDPRWSLEGMAQYSEHDRYILAGFARREAEKGNFDTANEFLARIKEKGTLAPVEPLLSLAETAAKHGKDPKPYLESAKRAAGYYYKDRDNHILIRIDRRERLQQLADIAIAAKSANTSPLQYVNEALSLANRLGGEEENVLSLIRMYAGITEYEKAQSLIDQVRKNRSLRKEDKDYLTHNGFTTLVLKQLEEGKLDEATKTAERKRDEAFTAEVLARRAVIEAERGEDPTASIERASGYAQQYLKTIQGKKNEAYLQQRLLETYAYVGLAYSLSLIPELAEKAFQKAVEVAELTPEYNNLLRVAEISGRTPLSMEHLLRKAYATVERLKDGDSLDQVEFTIGHEDIIKTAIKAGELRLAEELLSSITDFSKGNGAMEAAEFWMQIADAHAKKALPKSRVDILSSSEIQQLLQTGNEDVKQAITHFGLDKKV